MLIKIMLMLFRSLDNVCIAPRNFAFAQKTFEFWGTQPFARERRSI